MCMLYTVYVCNICRPIHVYIKLFSPIYFAVYLVYYRGGTISIVMPLSLLPVIIPLFGIMYIVMFETHMGAIANALYTIAAEDAWE